MLPPLATILILTMLVLLMDYMMFMVPGLILIMQMIWALVMRMYMADYLMLILLMQQLVLMYMELKLWLRMAQVILMVFILQSRGLAVLILMVFTPPLVEEKKAFLMVYLWIKIPPSHPAMVFILIQNLLQSVAVFTYWMALITLPTMSISGLRLKQLD